MCERRNYEEFKSLIQNMLDIYVPFFKAIHNYSKLASSNKTIAPDSPLFTLRQDCILIMERYQKVEKSGLMGEGTYGVVYKAFDRHTDSFVAMKRIRLELEEEGIPSTTLREIAVLRQLKVRMEV